MRILIAEDEDNIAEAYIMTLESRGHKVTVTRKGQECINEYAASCNIVTSRNSIKNCNNLETDSPDRIVS